MGFAGVRELFGTLLQQVCHFKVDVMAGHANAAADQHFKKKRIPRSIQFLSGYHAMREMQREVNMGLAFENRLHMNYSTSNHPTQLHAANDIDCCFVAILSR